MGGAESGGICIRVARSSCVCSRRRRRESIGRGADIGGARRWNTRWGRSEGNMGDGWIAEGRTGIDPHSRVRTPTAALEAHRACVVYPGRECD